MIKVNSPKQCDILIVGGGTAGLMAAVAAAERGARVIVAEKADTRRSGGGATGNDHFACYIPGYHESVDSYMHELEQGMCKGADPRVQRVFAERSFEIVKDWEKWGINMRPFGDEYVFEGHTLPGHPRCFLKIDGRDQKKCLTNQARRCGVMIDNRTSVTRYISREGRVVGAIAIDISRPEPEITLYTAAYNQVMGISILVISLLLLLFYLFSRYFLGQIIAPLHSVVEGMREMEEGNLTVHVEPAGQSEIRTMIHSFNRMVRELKASIEENERVQQKKHQAEVRALQSQINPHFLVNTLNSIRFMAQVSRFDGIRKMAEALIKILSCSFRGSISFYTVREELDVLDSYIYLMKIRYSDGFEVEYQIDRGCLDYKMPRLILQPIVENSIVHGLAEKEDDIGHLKISLEDSADCTPYWAAKVG